MACLVLPHALRLLVGSSSILPFVWPAPSVAVGIALSWPALLDRLNAFRDLFLGDLAALPIILLSMFPPLQLVAVLMTSVHVGLPCVMSFPALLLIFKVLGLPPVPFGVAACPGGVLSVAASMITALLERQRRRRCCTRVNFFLGAADTPALVTIPRLMRARTSVGVGVVLRYASAVAVVVAVGEACVLVVVMMMVSLVLLVCVLAAPAVLGCTGEVSQAMSLRDGVRGRVLTQPREIDGIVERAPYMVSCWWRGVWLLAK